MNQQQINRINEIVAELNILLPVVATSHYVTGALAVNEETQSVVGLALSMVALVVEDVPSPEPKGKPEK